MDLTVSTVLTVPSGTPGKPPIEINLGAILISEQRQDEVAAVTPMKAPELLAEFNRSWRELHRIVATLTANENQAKKAVAKRKGVILLEVVPVKLAELKLSTSVDLREAVINTDPEYQQLQEVADQLAAVIEHLKGKMKSFENAFTSVKKIMGEDTYNMAGRGRNHSLSGDTSRPAPTGRPAVPSTPAPASTPARQIPPPTSQPRPGFGKPRYGNNG